MRTRRDDRAGKAGWAGGAGWLLLFVFFLPAYPALPAHPAFVFAQVPYAQVVAGLSSADPKVRLHSAALLKESPYVEAAIPLARLISDQDNAVQLEAIAAEISIFTTGKGGAKAAQAVFDAGTLALGPAPVPPVVLLTLRLATRDDSPKVGLEALYAFGALGGQSTGADRRDLQQASLNDLKALLGLPDPAVRLAAVRVIGRLYERRPGDAPVDEGLGDLVIAAVNGNDRAMKIAAMDALGALRETRAVEGLTELFQFYGKGDLAEAALAALARIGHRSSAPLFLLQLSSKSTPLKVLAIEGLARTGDASHIAAIQAALKRERDDRVASASYFASAMLSNGPIEQLVDALNRPKSHDVAREYLAEIAPGRVSQLSRYVQDPSPRMRTDVADIVFLSGDPQGVRVVAPLLTDQDKQVAMAAERATMRLKTDR